MNQKKWICEIGCGEKKVIQGSIGIDIRKTDAIDIIADSFHIYGIKD